MPIEKGTPCSRTCAMALYHDYSGARIYMIFGPHTKYLLSTWGSLRRNIICAKFNVSQSKIQLSIEGKNSLHCPSLRKSVCLMNSKNLEVLLHGL